MNVRYVMLMAWMMVVAATSPSDGQLSKLPKVKQFGIDGFRLMLQHQGLNVSQTHIASALDEAPESTVMVLLGDLTLVPRFSGQMNRFVERGGALLVASDLRGLNVAPSSLLGVWVGPTRLVSPNSAYRSFRDCPVVKNLDHRAFPGLFENVTTIVANRPGQLVNRTRTVRPVAWLPSRRRPGPALIGAYQQGLGRMLFVADHSIFVNEMLIHGDNARFANNVCRWLCDGGTRETLVVVHDGRILPTWGIGENPPAIPLASLLRAVQRGGWEDLPIGDSVLPVLNASLADFQRTDQFNVHLDKLSRGLFGTRYPARVVLLVIMGLILASCLRWLSFSRSKPRSWFSPQDWRRPIEPRFIHAAHRRQYQPCLRSLVREFFVEAGFRDWNSKRGPKVAVKTPTGRTRISRRIRKLWKLAARGIPRRVSKRRLSRSIRMIDELRELQLSGDLSLE